jgi:hypothetical protein
VSIEAAMHVVEATPATETASASVTAPSSSAKSTVEVVLREETVLITKRHHWCHSRIEATHTHHSWIKGIRIHHVLAWMHEY